MTKTFENMIALYFAGVVKTGAELRAAIKTLNETTLFNLTDEECEMVARKNEEAQGISFGFTA
jgi:hypothetical protein